MSKTIRDEQERRISELEALVYGLSSEVTRLISLVDKCEQHMTKVVLTLDRLAQQLKGGE